MVRCVRGNLKCVAPSVDCNYGNDGDCEECKELSKCMVLLDKDENLGLNGWNALRRIMMFNFIEAKKEYDYYDGLMKKSKEDMRKYWVRIKECENSINKLKKEL